MAAVTNSGCGLATGGKMSTNRYIAVVVHGDYSVVKDTYNNYYAVFCKATGFSQQVSRNYLYKGHAVRKMKLLQSRQPLA